MTPVFDVGVAMIRCAVDEREHNRLLELVFGRSLMPGLHVFAVVPNRQEDTNADPKANS